MSAEELIDILENRSLLPPTVIGNLRQFVARSLKIVTPESLAKLLVERGLLTQFQAKQLFDHVAPTKPAAQEDDLSLAPVDDPNAVRQAKLVQKTTSNAPQATAKRGAVKSAADPPSVQSPLVPAPSAKTARAAERAKPAANPKSNAGQASLESPLSGAGPLDELLGDVVGGERPASFDGQALAPVHRRAGVPKPVLLSVAAGALVVALAVGLIVALGRSNGDVEWQLAEKDFEAGGNAEAISKLDAFLAKFPNHPRAGAADVYRNVARLRQAASSKTDSLAAVEVAHDVLPKIVGQPGFAEARRGLNTLLPDLAILAVKQAKAGGKASFDQRRKLAEAAVEAVALAKDPRYSPDSTKPWAALESTEAEAAILMREVDRQAAFDRAAAEIRAAAAAGNLAAAFDGRDQLLRNYPELRPGDAIDQLDRELAQAEASALKVDSQRQKAETKSRPTPILSAVVFATINERVAADARSGRAGPSPEPNEAKRPIMLSNFQSPGGPAIKTTARPVGLAISVFANGTAYWINANDGKPVGRQFLGFESFAPLPIKPFERNEFIAYDARHRELSRIKAEMATVVWRQPLGAPLAGEPAIRGTVLFCTTQTGRLLEIDLESGDVIGSIQLAESIQTGPIVSIDGSTMYVVTERGNLFAFEAKKLQPRGATRLGVRRGAVLQAPIELGTFLAIIDRSDSDDAAIRLLAGSASGGDAKPVQTVSLASGVSTPPLADGKRLFVATDRGEVAVFAVNGSPTAPLVTIATALPDSIGELPRFLALRQNQLLVGGKGIAAYDASSTGNLRPIWRRFEDESVVTAPSFTGDSIVGATRQPALPGVVVRALDPATGATKWETILAAPIAGEPLVDPAAKRMQTIHPLAGIQRQNNVPTAPQEFIAAPIAFAGRTRLVLTAVVPYGSHQIAVVGTNPRGTESPAEIRLLFGNRREGDVQPSPWAHALACAPVAMADNLIVVDRDGSVILLNPTSAEPIGSPLIMPMAREAESPGVPSIAIGSKSEIIVNDGGSRIYRLELRETPSNRIVSRAEESLDHPIVSPIVIAGNLVFSADDSGAITARNLADLKTVKSWPLGARLQWGPVVASDLVLASTDRQLICLNAKAELVWRKPLPAGVPVGSVLAQGADLLFASMTGTLWSVDRQTGDRKRTVDLGEPLASGPVEFDKHWTVAAADGSLLFVAGW